jgi:PAS domain S-box-containing protein
LLLRDGTEKTISEQGEVIIDAAGDPQRFVGTVLDISDRQRAERALRSAEALFRGLVEQSLVGIHIIQDGKYPYVNPKFAEIFGYTVEEVLALESWLELAVEEEREKIAEQVRRRLSGVSDNAHYLSRGRRKDGTIIDIELHGAQTEFDGRPAVIGTLLDITERKRAEETLRRIQEQTRQSQKMEAIGRLAGGVAHDFNNLLTIIVGNTELAREGLEENAPRLDALNDVLDACDRAAALTRQLLAFSRRQVLEPVVLDLNQLITDIDRLLRRLIGEDIQLVTVLGAASARVKADPAQLEQILLNLTVNARDAMPSGGRLTIETYHVELDADYAELHSDVRPGPYVLLAVSDTGAGMDEATRARLFEPFFTTKSPGRGTGMGLSMTYGIVKQSGGHISVYSELGRGTTFKIYFPRIEASISIAKPEAQVGATVGGNETILLVEDEHAVRGLAKRILETHGYLVLEAHHGRDAIRISDEYPGPIHLLVTDVIMPEMSGRQVADRLAESRPEIRVLFVSGYTDNAIMHHGVLEASTAFLQKPFTRDSLARKVRQVLDKQ